MSSDNLVIEGIKRKKTELFSKYNIRKIGIFGSFAKNTQREDSDIDLVVISKDFQEKDFWQRINVLSEAIYEIFVPIEAMAFTPEEWERGDSSIADYAKKKEKVFV